MEDNFKVTERCKLPDREFSQGAEDHDRLSPVVDNGFRNEPINPTSDAESNSSKGDISEDSDYSYSDSDSGSDDDVENGDLNRDRPRRQRQQRYLPDTIPWGALRV